MHGINIYFLLVLLKERFILFYFAVISKDNIFAYLWHGRRKNTEAKTKVVAAVWGQN